MKQIFLAGLAVFTLMAFNSVTPATARSIRWSGYTWNVRDSLGKPDDPEDNIWSASPQNVWVDERGWLHMKVRKDGGKWLSSEIELDHPLGHGLYAFEVAGGNLDYQHGVLGLYLYDKQTKDEVDIEFSRWGWADISTATRKPDTENPTVQYMVDPNSPKQSKYQSNFNVNATPSTHSFYWFEDAVRFGNDEAPLVRRRLTAKRMTARIDLWHCAPCQGDPTHDFEVVLKGFIFRSAR